MMSWQERYGNTDHFNFTLNNSKLYDNINKNAVMKNKDKLDGEVRSGE